MKRIITSWIGPLTLIVLYLFVFLLTTAHPKIAALPQTPSFARNFITDRTDLMYFYEITSEKLGYEHHLQNTFNTYPPLVFFFLLGLRAITHALGDGFLLFSLLFSGIMSATLLGNFFLTRQLLHHFKRSEAWLWLFILPSLLYFSLSRFDNALTLLILTSLYFITKKNFPKALLFLALGIVWKWVSALLIPTYFLFMMYEYKKTNYSPQIWRTIRTAWIIFFTIIIIIHLIAIISLGANDVLNTYLLQAQRTFEFGSIYAALFGGSTFAGTTLYPGFFSISKLTTNIIGTITTIFALLPNILIFFWFEKNIERDKQSFTTKHIFLWSTTTIISFVLWTKIYSPQWIWWFLPLLIITIPKKQIILPLIFFDLLNYFLFPIIFTYLTLPNIPALGHATTIIRTILLFSILLIMCKEIQRNTIVKHKTP